MAAPRPGERINFDRQNLIRKVYRKINADHRDELKWTRAAQKRVAKNLRNMDEDALRKLDKMSASEIRDLARHQAEHIESGRVPKIVRQLAWRDEDGHYHNPFWYH